jgi:Nucleotide modification associated domain 3
MRGLLVRVGADQSGGGGNWNGPVDLRTGHFAYVPIPETKPIRPGLARPYAALVPSLSRFGVALPAQISGQNMHLDPDFEYLTYGDRGPKGKQIVSALGSGDLLVFYAGLRDIQSNGLVYAVIGLYIVDRIARAVTWPDSEAHCNAHTRRQLAADADDVIVLARKQGSGRLERCIAVGEYRDRAYRVRKDLLADWGNISANDGYLQRSAVFPSLLKPEQFWNWWRKQNAALVRTNTLDE